MKVRKTSLTLPAGTLFLLIPLSVLVLNCKHSHRGSHGTLFSYTGSSIDTVVVGSQTMAAPDECVANIFNLYTDAANNALLLNGAMTGLGTANPAGKQLATDSFYFQCLRIFSFFDWNIQDELQNQMTGRCLPENVRMAYGVFDKYAIQNMEHPRAAEVDKFKSAMAVLTSSPMDLDLVSLPSMDPPTLWPRSSFMDSAITAASFEASKKKMDYARKTSAQDIDLKEKLKAMLVAHNPLAMFFSADFPPNNTLDAKLLIEAYLPPLHSFDIPHIDAPATWKMTDGTKRYELPKEIDISVAKLTHVGYMYDQATERYPVIKVELFKDFSRADILKTRVTFGELSAGGDTPGMLPVASKDYRNTLYVGFYPNFPIREADSSVVRKAKEQFNEVFSQFKIDARIHRLSIELKRDQNVSGSLAPDRTMLRPHFIMKDSEISFRVHHLTDETAEILAFKAVGFKCEPQGNSQDCYLDLATQADLTDFFTKENSGLTHSTFRSRLSGALRSAFAYVVRYNTAFVINWNIQEIEAAIDAEFVELFGIIFDKQLETRKKIRQRLDKEIFKI